MAITKSKNIKIDSDATVLIITPILIVERWLVIQISHSGAAS